MAVKGNPMIQFATHSR